MYSKTRTAVRQQDGSIVTTSGEPKPPPKSSPKPTPPPPKEEAPTPPPPPPVETPPEVGPASPGVLPVNWGSTREQIITLLDVNDEEGLIILLNEQGIYNGKKPEKARERAQKYLEEHPGE